MALALVWRLRRLPRMDVVVRRSRRRSVVGGVCVLGWLACLSRWRGYGAVRLLWSRGGTGCVWLLCEAKFSSAPFP